MHADSLKLYEALKIARVIPYRLDVCVTSYGQPTTTKKYSLQCYKRILKCRRACYLSENVNTLGDLQEKNVIYSITRKIPYLTSLCFHYLCIERKPPPQSKCWKQHFRLNGIIQFQSVSTAFCILLKYSKQLEYTLDSQFEEFRPLLLNHG